MKRILSSILSITLLIAPVALLPMTTGCAVLTPGSSSAVRFQKGARLASYIGATAYLQAHPETRPAFVTARDQLAVLSTAETIDATTLLAVINQLPIKEFKSPTATLVIGVGAMVLNDFAGELPLDRVKELQPIAKALAEGLTLAIGPQ